MRPAVLLSNNYFLALAFVFGWTVDETRSCDTKWIRLVYMMSCGKKKRETDWAQNHTSFEDLPSDFDGAFKYFKEKDPSNPMLADALLYEGGGDSSTLHHVPKLLIFDEERKRRSREGEATALQSPAEAPESGSVLLRKLFPKTEPDLRLGIQGFPKQWNITEIIDERIIGNTRRQIDKLIEECCKVPPVTECNGSTFLGACK